MTIVQIIVSFIIIWWLVLFMALPFMVERDENPALGNDKGAPKSSHIIGKMIITTIISIVLTGIFFFCMEHGYLDLISSSE